MYLKALIASIFAFLLIKLFQRYGEKLGLIDHPDQNKIHQKKKLTQAGLITTLLLTIFLLYEFVTINFKYDNISKLWFIIIVLFFLTFICFIDFKKEINPILRLITHLSLTYLALSSLQSYSSSENFINFIPERLYTLFIIYIWVYLMNCYNFIDGFDGFFLINSIYFFINLLLLGQSDFSFKMNELILVLLSINLVFLIFNFPSAKFFLGDTGSIPMGFIIGWFFFLEIQSGNLKVISFIIYPIFDCVFTHTKMIFQKKNIFKRHQNFLFFQILKKFENNQKNTFLFFMTIFIFYTLINLTFSVWMALLINFLITLVIPLVVIFKKNG